MFSLSNTTNRNVRNLVAAFAAGSLAALAAASEPPAATEEPLADSSTGEQTIVLDQPRRDDPIYDVGMGGEEPIDTGISLSPCDFDSSGDVSSDDYLQFVDAWLVDSEKADFTKDQVVDSQDFFEYIECLLAGK